MEGRLGVSAGTCKPAGLASACKLVACSAPVLGSSDNRQRRHFLLPSACVITCWRREDAQAALDLYLEHVLTDTQLMDEEEAMQHYLAGILAHTPSRVT